MPELPEVETTKRGIAPYLKNKVIDKIIVRQDKLRVEVTPRLHELCSGQTIVDIHRRGKFLILQLTRGSILIHLGMSGHLYLSQQSDLKKHDHIDLCLKNGTILRYNDPRRFGLWVYVTENPAHSLHLKNLGPEPLSSDFNSQYLFLQSRNRKQCIKSFLMNNTTVVGVGNIYATESLFLAGIHPQKMAGMLTPKECDNLCEQIKSVLLAAIHAGGTTLKDFLSVEGKPGYFSHSLRIYGKENQPCSQCNTPIKKVTIAGRSSAFCPHCQSPGNNLGEELMHLQKNKKG
ncbi:formamidopyrimidine-DNA glycosylase (plasmid) [Legionella adelaidensis]|uniref:Formamidopyrimidine-DNA glycosylase n=1 Tax=Legionella adelaidensis TaxID=45056 RepID=A0A0W0R5V7_9GAMM|nr:bifunctional DNA-formamidopyrimidine glycosylase/DNA-(apurinic or apyrimidinic site) lyase [Legionella adelaidensis]KTC66445.1 formamidopyrimidine-DNA glycosylase [Legionella adelaidensis]VEH86267.1 formamidopyrimidine-DNA glycosylase [Legionella adelaidensis]